MSTSRVAAPLRDSSPLVSGLAVLAGLLAYIAILHYAYVERVAPVYAYQGYTYRAPDHFTYGACIVMACILALILPRRIERPSTLVAWMILIVAVVPSLIVPNLSRSTPPDKVLESSVALAVGFVIIVVVGTRRTPRRDRVPPAGASPTTMIAILGTSSLLVYGYIAVTTGLSLDLPSLNDVYDTRFDFRAAAASAPLLGYVIPFQANVINPALIVRGIFSGKWQWIALGFLGQALIYATIGQKAILFSTPMIIGVAVMFRISKRPPAIFFVLGMAAVCTLSMILDTLLGGKFVTSVFVRRFLLTPGLLFGAYISVWSDIPKGHWGYSTITFGLVDYDHPFTPAFFVGQRFFGRSELSANASIFADGYANFGYGGLIVEAAALALLLRGIDHVSRGLPVAVSGITFLIPSLELANTGLPTVLLTHGLLAAMLLARFLPREGWWNVAGGGGAVEAHAPPGLGGRRPDTVERSTRRE